MRQILTLDRGPQTEKAARYTLRGLAGEETRRKVRAFRPALLRTLQFRFFDGRPVHLWALTSAGYAVAGADLGRALRVPRVDVGAAFAEHFVFLTDLFVRLVRPYLGAPSLRELPLRWDVAEDVELPWRERDGTGDGRTRVIRPDAVLEVPSAKRRYFIECETGSHTLVPKSPNKDQATLRKLERYDAYVSGLADLPARLSHYQRKYPDGWPCELLFLEPNERRQRNTLATVASFLGGRAGTRLVARAFTLEEAAVHCAAAFSKPEGTRPVQPGSAAGPGGLGPPFYGEPEHRAVKGFVLEMSAALTEANAVLRRQRLEPVRDPASKALMLEFLRKAQAEMQRRRAAGGPSRDG